MSTVEIIAGVLLVIAGLVIILVVLAQESKEQGLTSAIGGGANESFYEHNMGKTRDAKLSKFTRNAAIVLFIVTLAVNLFATINQHKSSDTSDKAAADTEVVSTVESETEGGEESTAEAAAESTDESPAETEAVTEAAPAE